jgi:hypothetical protein
MTPRSATEHGHDHDHGDDHRRGLLAFVVSFLRPHSHDAVESVDAALGATSEGVRALKVSLGVLAATALVQVVIVAATGSVALL